MLLPYRYITTTIFVLLFVAPVVAQRLPAGDPPIDAEATRQTRALLANLRDLSSDHILFGQEDALAYGVGWRGHHEWQSDIEEVCGMSPAIFGWDVSKLGTSHMNIDSVNFKHMQEWIRLVHRQGGINTISWHLDNPVTGGDSWDVGEKVVREILPGGTHHAAYLTKLDDFATFVRGVRRGFPFRRDVPILFRPFHEHSGSWFWWGKDHCTPEEYVALWHFTVQYLKEEKKLHNLLYVYSPDIVESKEEYMSRYPGDDYVDVFGTDNYHDFRNEGTVINVARRLRMVVEMADDHGKIAALTETGLESIPESDWWTQKLMKALTSDPVASRIAYAMVWRNRDKTHHYGPYPTHPSAGDFKQFCADDTILMREELPRRMYRRKK